MIWKRSLLTLLFITVLGFLAFVPKDDDPLDKLVAALQKWTEINPQEKVYLHMDKPYYALGDTIWFKAYVVTGSRHQLSALSGALYVDLITEKDSIVKSLKLPVSAGLSMGDFTLEDDLREGNYRIRAYTQWMRNAGEDYFFDRTFTVGTPISTEVIGKSAYEYKTVNGKQVLTALLNYTDEGGKALSGKEVQYDLMIEKQRVYSKSARTDTSGNISIAIS
ncbi:TonB-dependent receptor, partial [Pedobacter sp. JCM 36344]